MSIALLAKGKFAAGEQTIAAPEVTLNVVRPVVLELAAPGIEVKAGETVELKGKIARKGTARKRSRSSSTSFRPGSRPNR